MRNRKAGQVAWIGVMFALSMALSFLESMVTPLLGLLPAMKLGLANIVVMYALLFLDALPALALVLLKALFSFLTRGATAGFLSLCGGLLSFLVLWGLLHLPGRLSGYIFSVCGALAHNMGQLAGAAVLLSSGMALRYAPFLLVFGVGVGFLTYLVSRGVFPALARIRRGEGRWANKIKF